MSSFYIRPLNSNDRDWVLQFITEHWGTDMIVAHGVIYYPHSLPGFVAIQEGEKVGLITYHVEGDSCEIVSLDSLRPSIGVGTALIEAVKEVARQSAKSNRRLALRWAYGKKQPTPSAYGMQAVVAHYHKRQFECIAFLSKEGFCACCCS